MIGRTLAHYEILEKIGEGGMGEVYRARDTKLDRDVALKILPAAMASDPARLRRFEREAKTVAGLNHPHIVTLYSIEAADGVRFLTMELIQGRSVADLLPPDGFPLPRVLDLGIAVADALAAAHARSVAHRDIKPANVMVTADGRVKVLDFGLAKPIESAPGDDTATRAQPLTVDGAVIGTVPYMSPEQLRGREVDHRSDIFSLGVLLYELCTGHRPFRGDTQADVMSSILTASPPELARVKPDHPCRLGSVVERCLQKDPSGRYAAATEVRDELAALRAELESGRTVATGASTPSPDRTPRVASSRRRPALIGVAVLALALLGLWAGLRSRDRAASDSVPKTIAVLPFENLSPQDSSDFFSTGIYEDVITALGSLHDLKVISRTSVAVAMEEADTPREIGHRLDARYVVEGSVRRFENQVRVTAQLVDAATEQSLWSSTYDRELRDVLAVQASIAQDIAATLRTTLQPAEAAKLRDV
ncbi:MAG: protein kinase, partial [Gemmatimonadetes bacterium]|nr:protein kinase [Gemmatimonadota bacterium]